MEFICKNINWVVIVIGIVITVSILYKYKKTCSRQLLNYLPTVWTSLGILGTFITIVHVLGDGTNSWNDVNDLVKKISPAFETSIIGIIGSIVTSICAKWLYSKEDLAEIEHYSQNFTNTPEYNIGRICNNIDTLDQKFDFLNSNHEKMIGIMQKILEASEEQHKVLIEETKAQRSLAERMISDFTQNLKEFYATMYDEEKLHMQELTEQYLNGINQIIVSTHGTIKSKFEKLLTDHEEGLNSALEQEGKNFDLLCEKIIKQLQIDSKTLVESFEKTTQSQTSAVDTLLKESQDILSKTSEKTRLSIEGIMSDNKTYLETVLSEFQQHLTEVTSNNNQFINTVATETQEAVSKIAGDNSSSLTALSNESKENIKKITKELIAVADSLKQNFEDLTHQLPNDLALAKEELIKTLNNLTESKFDELSTQNKQFVAQLLQQVNEYNKNITAQSIQSQTQWINAINEELAKLLKKVDENVQTNSQQLVNTTNGLNKDLSTIANVLNTSANDYASITKLLTPLVKALQKETDATESYANSISSTNSQLSAIQKLISEVIQKNLQLRQELAQWKRTHKQIKVNPDTGEKECPNCHEWNPVEASYCRKCATSFWECKPIVDKKESNTDKA